MRIKFTLLCLAVALVGVVAFAGPTAVGQTSPRTITVTSSKFVFTPGELTLKKGEPVILILKSSDVAHGLRFRELNVDIKVDKGGTAQVQFTPTKTGDFVGHCSVFCGSGHGGMMLTLHVVE